MENKEGFRPPQEEEKNNEEEFDLDSLKNKRWSYEDLKKKVLELTEKGKSDFVLENLDEFSYKGVSSGEISIKKIVFLELIGKGEVDLVVDNIDKFSTLIDKQEAVIKIIKSLDKIKNLNHREIFEKLNKYYCSAVFYNFEKFTGIPESDHKEIVDKILKENSSSGSIIADNFEKFIGISESDHKEIALYIIENTYTGGGFIADNLEKFTGISESDHKEIVDKILEKDAYPLYLVFVFEKFTGISESDHKEIAEKYIKKVGKRSLIDNLDKFTGLDEKTIKELGLDKK